MAIWSMMMLLIALTTLPTIPWFPNKLSKSMSIKMLPTALPLMHTPQSFPNHKNRSLPLDYVYLLLSPRRVCSRTDSVAVSMSLAQEKVVSMSVMDGNLGLLFVTLSPRLVLVAVLHPIILFQIPALLQTERIAPVSPWLLRRSAGSLTQARKTSRLCGAQTVCRG